IYPLDGEGGPNQVFGPPRLCDQPKLGYSSDKFVVGCNLFDSADTYHGALLMVANKAQGLAGVSMSEDEYAPNTSVVSLVPAQNMTAGVPTAYVAFNENPNVAAAGVLAITGLPKSTSVAQHDVAMSATSAPPAAP